MYKKILMPVDVFDMDLSDKAVRHAANLAKAEGASITLVNILPASSRSLLRGFNADIKKFMAMGAAGVQMGTRFIATHECDAPQIFKDILINAKEEDIVLMKSPVGYPARGVKTKLLDMVEAKTAPDVKCISNCVVPCHQGVESKAVGYCIADRLADAAMGDANLGLYFSGSNGYKIDKIVSVKELMKELAGDDA